MNPNPPYPIVLSLETPETALQGLQRRELTCVLRRRGETTQELWGLLGPREQVLTWAKSVRREWTFITDRKGLDA